jgi:hypothetical protein
VVVEVEVLLQVLLVELMELLVVQEVVVVLMEAKWNRW